jgi:alpha-N-arabinofuranosidase
MMSKLCCAVVGFSLPVLVALPAWCYDARVTVDGSVEGRPVNRLILGSNVQWVDRGDEMVDHARKLRSVMVQAAQTLGPTVLRYPGGSQSDVYQWRNGIGAERGNSSHFFSGAVQTIDFGTDEFLELCRRIGAKPLVTVNVATGLPQDAADWVRYVRQIDPAADWWEIGNEPYLKDEKQSAIALGPEEFVRRAKPIMEAMRTQAPSIKLGIPLRSDTLGGLPATPYPGFNEKVLRELRGIDFVSLHDSYAPASFSKSYSDRDMFLALMAAPDQISEDFRATRAQMRALLGRTVPIAVTEWSALFSIGRRTDNYIATTAGAIFAADFLNMLAQDDEVLMANYWSLSGNWYFGAIDRDGKMRPVANVLAAYAKFFKGSVLPNSLEAPAMPTPQVGYVAARPMVRKLSALAVRDGARITIAIVNRSIDETADVSVTLNGKSMSGSSAQVYAPKDPFSNEAAWMKQETRAEGNGIGTSIPPHAISLVEIELQ